MEKAPQTNPESLINLLVSIKEWEGLAYWDMVETIDFFMSDLVHLCFGYFHTHLDEAKKCAHLHADLLMRARPLIDRYYVLHCEAGIRNYDAEFDDPWERACWLRSSIAAFEAMFSEVTGELNAGFIKKYIESAKGKMETLPSIVPANAPQEHWWWHSK